MKLINEYLEYLEIERGRAKKTIDNYQRYLARFFRFSGVSEPKHITDEIVRKYRLWLNRENLDRRTQNYHLIALRGFLKYLVRRNLKSLAPEAIELAKTTDRDIEIVDADDLERLLKAPGNENTLSALRDRAMLELLFSTGLRVSELCSLDRDLVNPQKTEFSIRGKGGKIRVVFVSENTRVALKQYLDKQQYKLYELIWQRFVATQMPEALFDATSVDITSNGKRAAYIFHATGSVLKFDGFLNVYPLKTEDILIPELTQGEHLDLDHVEPKQHFTEPPPRYSEASLIKILEKNGIGRPSTYAPTIGTIQERNYIQKNEAKRFTPTEMGIMVTDMLVEHFPNIVDVAFTAEMEETLDKIADGTEAWVPAIRAFYEPFEKHLEIKYKTVEKQIVEETTNELCEKCTKPMVIKTGRFGKFLACSGFPECKNTKRLPEDTLGIKCPSCKDGDLIQRRSKRGKMFYGCSAYPKCTFALWDRPTGEPCPKCGSLLVTKGKNILCSNKECAHKTPEALSTKEGE